MRKKEVKIITPCFVLPQNPIFIVGYPRSGTTLLQRLLLTQPGFYSFLETHYFNVVEKSVQFDEKENIHPSCLGRVFEKIYEKMEFRFTPQEIETFHRLADEKKLSSKNLFEFIVTRFLLKQPGIDSSASFRWIEKTPYHANFLNRIVKFYPDVQILHIIRHPVPAIFSRKRKFPYNRQTPVSILAKHWNNIHKNIERFKEKFPGYIYTLRYEDLVKEKKKELGAIGNFLNMNFDFSSISKVEQISKTLILPSEVWKLEDRNKNFENTNETYRDIITKTDAALVETIVMKKMKKYGYSPYFGKNE